jgi:hypothetical protein
MMKRGLSSPDLGHSSPELYSQRQDRVRSVLRDRGLDAALVYGDVSCGGDIAYLSHAMLYWADAVLVIPANSPSVLVKTLGPRTDTWFRATAFIDELTSGPRLAPLLARQIAEGGYGSLGLVDYSQFPAGVVDELVAGGVQLTDLDGIVGEYRNTPDALGLMDLRECAELGRAGLRVGRSCVATGRLGQIRAEAEYVMRRGGAWDAVVLATPTPSGSVVVDVRCQLRDAWYSAQHTVTAEGEELDQPIFDLLSDAVRSGASERDLVALLPFSEAGEEYELTVQDAPSIESFGATGAPPAWHARDDAVVHLRLRTWNCGELVAARGDTLRITRSGSKPLDPGTPRKTDTQ